MLKFHWRPVAPAPDTELAPSVAVTNPDLRVRNLLDDPRLSDALAGLGPDRASITSLPCRIPGSALTDALRAGLRERAAA